MSDWTLCSTKLPDNKGEYLVTYHPCFWDLVEETVKVGLDTFRGKVWAKRKYQKVIAWMPLPEPCQADSKKYFTRKRAIISKARNVLQEQN